MDFHDWLSGERVKAVERRSVATPNTPEWYKSDERAKTLQEVSEKILEEIKRAGNGRKVATY